MASRTKKPVSHIKLNDKTVCGIAWQDKFVLAANAKTASCKRCKRAAAR